MSAYTQQDLIDIRAAKKKLAKGERVGQATIMGQVIRFETVTMAELDRFERQLIRALKRKRPRNITLISDKGL